MGVIIVGSVGCWLVFDIVGWMLLLFGLCVYFGVLFMYLLMGGV